MKSSVTDGGVSAYTQLRTPHRTWSALVNFSRTCGWLKVIACLSKMVPTLISQTCLFGFHSSLHCHLHHAHVRQPFCPTYTLKKPARRYKCEVSALWLISTHLQGKEERSGTRKGGESRTEDSGHFEMTRFVHKRRRVDKTLTLEDEEKDEEMMEQVRRSERKLLESDEENGIRKRRKKRRREERKEEEERDEERRRRLDEQRRRRRADEEEGWQRKKVDGMRRKQKQGDETKKTIAQCDGTVKEGKP